MSPEQFGLFHAGVAIGGSGLVVAIFLCFICRSSALREEAEKKIFKKEKSA